MPGEPIPMSVGLGVMFDSTHFGNGSTVVVKAEYWDNHGSYYQNEGATVVKNSALLAAFPESDMLAARWEADLRLVSPFFGKQLLVGEWDPIEFCESLAGHSIVFAPTHGHNGTIGSLFAAKMWPTSYTTSVRPFGNDTYILGHPTWIQSAGLESRRVAQMGSGLPPYNSTHQPPIWIAYALSCQTGLEQNFIRFCLPYNNAYGTWLENQAWIGYNCDLYVKEYPTIAAQSFSVLADGGTVGYMVQKIVDINPPVQDATTDKPLETDDISIYGDEDSRLLTVYTGTAVSPVGWFRNYETSSTCALCYSCLCVPWAALR